MYNHENQYRCTIIRGKSQKENDNILPAYAKIITDICPCEKKRFEVYFNTEIARYIPASATKKTLDNHRTEIAGKLFGMYYVVSQDGNDSTLYVYPSERTMKFVEDNDQPAFFKDVCYKMQFPNGMTKIESIKERINLKISIRSNSYVLKLLILAQNAGVQLTKSDIGYYVLNSLDVLTLKASPLEVIEQIEEDKKVGVYRKIHTDKKGSSYDSQHINEQINYLELANLIEVGSDSIVKLNSFEMETIKKFAAQWNVPPYFNISKYDFLSRESKKQFQFDWDCYYSKLSSIADEFATTSVSLGIVPINAENKRSSGFNKVELGDEGELYVLNYERNRVKAYNPRFAGKVIHLGKTRGLGYDIQSVIAEDGDMAEFVKYVEVKSTKRVTEPDLSDDIWLDTINITRNEWIAAMQHKDFYSIFRVYFVRGKVIMYIIKDIYQKEKNGIIKVVPLTYRVDFGRNAIDEIIPNKEKVI